VTPITTATNTPGKPIKVGHRPRLIAITPDGKTAYVVNQGGTVTPIATATNTPGKPIKVGGQPYSAIAITPDGKTVYVANTGTNTVTPISTATNTPGKPIKVGVNRKVTPPGGHSFFESPEPWAIAITPDGKTAYVASFASGTVTPIATATNTPGKPIKVGKGAWAIAITPDGKTAYAISFYPCTATPISTATNKAGKPVKVGRGPEAIAIAP